MTILGFILTGVLCWICVPTWVGSSRASEWQAGTEGG